MDNSQRTKGTRPQGLRARNSLLILQELSQTAGQTINELSEKLHLSRTAVQNIIFFLQQEGLIADGGKRDSTSFGGKRAIFYRMRSDYKHSIFFYLSSQIIIAELYDFSLARLMYRMGDVSQLSYSDLLQHIVKMTQSLLRDAGILQSDVYGIAIAVSGTVDSDKGVLIGLTGDNYPEKWGTNLSMVQDLHDQLDMDADIYLDNMCNFSGLNSYVSLVENEVSSCLYVMAHSRGIGAAFIRNGRIDKGLHGLLGEIAHTTISYESSFPCRCGRKGCFEAMLYPDAVRRQTNAAIRKMDPCGLEIDSVNSMDDLLRKANEGNPCAIQEVTHLAGLFAQLLYNAQIMGDPACIIFHDSFSVQCDYFHHALLSACGEKSKGHLEVPIRLFFDTESFSERVRKGAALFLRNRYFDQFTQNL